MVDKISKLLSDDVTFRLSIVSVLIFCLGFLVKRVLLRKVDSNEELVGLEKVNIKSNVKTYINAIMLVILLAVWFSQIQEIFVSLFAIAAALVLATKELIMNMMGGVLIKLKSPFKVGDRIEVDNVRGFVIEKSLTVTKVLEIGPEKYSQQTTGDIVTIPNSLMLSKAIRNESYFKGYSVKAFTFRLPEEKTFADFETKALAWANEICRPYIKDAKQIIGDFCRKEGLLVPLIEPRVKILLGEEGEIELFLKMPVKNHEIGDIEQALFRKYLEYSAL